MRRSPRTLRATTLARVTRREEEIKFQQLCDSNPYGNKIVIHKGSIYGLPTEGSNKKVDAVPKRLRSHKYDNAHSHAKRSTRRRKKQNRKGAVKGRAGDVFSDHHHTHAQMRQEITDVMRGN